MFAIYKKEMRSYFINPIGYVYTGIFLVFSALLACYTTLIAESYSTSSYFTYMIFAFIILIPLLTMRLFAEERKLRTEQMLLTAPVSITGIANRRMFRPSGPSVILMLAVRDPISAPSFRCFIRRYKYSTFPYQNQ